MWPLCHVNKMAATQPGGADENSVAAIFDSMSYGPAPEAANVAQVRNCNAVLSLTLVAISFYTILRYNLTLTSKTVLSFLFQSNSNESKSTWPGTCHGPWLEWFTLIQTLSWTYISMINQNGWSRLSTVMLFTMNNNWYWNHTRYHSSITLNVAGLPDVAYSQFPSESKLNKILHNPPSY